MADAREPNAATKVEPNRGFVGALPRSLRTRCGCSTVGAGCAGAIAGAGAGVAVANAIFVQNDRLAKVVVILIGALVGLLGGLAAGAALACFRD